MTNGNHVTHNNKHTILINKTKFTPYCVPPAHAPASVFIIFASYFSRPISLENSRNPLIRFRRFIFYSATIVHKTDISKTSCFTFGGNKKLELDRPLPKKWSFRDKAISSFDHSDKHETRRIVRLLSIKQHII